MNKLFPKIPFVTDETPLSWAARQAAFHTGGRLLPFLKDMKVPADDLAHGSPEAIMRLCDKADQDPEPVFRNAITAIGGRRCSLRGNSFAANFTTGVVTRICPFCLAEDLSTSDMPDVELRHRFLWQLAPVRYCSVHGVLLRDIRLGAWHDKFHELQAMHDLIEAEISEPPDRSPRKPSDLQIYVERRLEGAEGPKWLDEQNIDQATRVTEMLGGLIVYGPNQKASAMASAMWDEAARAAWDLVSEGEGAVLDFLFETLESSRRQLGQARPRKAFGMLYTWLASCGATNAAGPIGKLLREVICEKVPLAPGQILFGEPVLQPRFSTIVSIAKSEMVGPQELREMLHAAGVEEKPMGAGAYNMVVEYARVADVIGAMKQAASVAEIEIFLGASEKVVPALMETGLLAPITGKAYSNQASASKIDVRSACHLLSYMKKNFVSVDEVPQGYIQVELLAKRSFGKLVVVLELIFKGHVSGICQLSGDQRMQGIYVDAVEVEALLQNLPQGLSEDSYLLFL
ncbi:TniQ family protein [Celeribacter halophilus]|uniref:TniQ family protein n=1 Tax=Celeribacter halophilus TaxID=576117 RepID=UPI003A8CB897